MARWQGRQIDTALARCELIWRSQRWQGVNSSGDQPRLALTMVHEGQFARNHVRSALGLPLPTRIPVDLAQRPATSTLLQGISLHILLIKTLRSALRTCW
jgi:hypothetical protein